MIEPVLNVLSSTKASKVIRSMDAPDYLAKTYELRKLTSNGATDNGLAQFSQIVKLWETALEQGNIPRRVDLSFQGFVGWHARMIISRLPVCGDLEFRIIGNDIADMFGHTLQTGDRFSSLPHVAFEDYAEYFKAIKSGGTYGRYSGIIPFEGRAHRTFDVLDLPAADEEGNLAFLYSFFLMGPRRRRA